MGPCENIGVYVCSHCEGEVRKKLCGDLSGQHTSVIACHVCHREYGPEWSEFHINPVPVC